MVFYLVIKFLMFVCHKSERGRDDDDSLLHFVV